MFFVCTSRRRHTRWPRDWSSDVCSSDLTVTPSRMRENFDIFDFELTDEEMIAINSLDEDEDGRRSEERRVGEEGRSRKGRTEGKRKIRIQKKRKTTTKYEKQRSTAKMSI